MISSHFERHFGYPFSTTVNAALNWRLLAHAVAIDRSRQQNKNLASLASACIMAETVDQRQSEPTAGAATYELERVVDPAHIPLYHELGLGRGVNVTDPDMWKSKTPYLVRKAAYPCSENSNIIGTQDCGKLERYKKEVSTFEMKKQEVWLSLQDSCSSKVKIGMDEQSSRSISSTKLIEGDKIETRTISFQSHFDDLPLYDDIESGAVPDVPDCFLQKCDDCQFEEDLAKWFLKRIQDREQKSCISGTKSGAEEYDSKKPAIKMLGNKLNELDSQEGSNKLYVKTMKDCKAFIEYMGITHYVSAIKLGACNYRTITSRSEQEQLGVRTSMAARSLAKGGLSGFLKKKFSSLTEEEQMIGIIDKENKRAVREAVIGFEIQPLYKLVRIQYIQVLLRIAIRNYIQSKEFKTGKYFYLYIMWCFSKASLLIDISEQPALNGELV